MVEIGAEIHLHLSAHQVGKRGRAAATGFRLPVQAPTKSW
jgi:hypothetical protein